MPQKKLIVVAGPTAVGKTSVSMGLARHLGAAIVSADSRQVYREMKVGTAKPTAEQRAEVRHYFVDTHSVVDAYDAAHFTTDALKVIGDLFETDDHVILCGGSGLYIKGVCEGFDDIPKVPDGVREEIIRNYERGGLQWLQARMRELDPVGLALLDEKNPHRLIRALEVKTHSGKSIATFRTNQPVERPFDIIKIGLELPRDELYNRIDERMDQMIADGLFEEAHALYPMRHNNALQTVGYHEIFAFMENAYDIKECVRLLKRNTRRYAKRQLTWFKKDTGFAWFSPEDVEGIIAFVEAGAAGKGIKV
jgi:tRNA dimethylallyltransferase